MNAIQTDTLKERQCTQDAPRAFLMWLCAKGLDNLVEVGPKGSTSGDLRKNPHMSETFLMEEAEKQTPGKTDAIIYVSCLAEPYYDIYVPNGMSKTDPLQG